MESQIYISYFSTLYVYRPFRGVDEMLMTKLILLSCSADTSFLLLGSATSAFGGQAQGGNFFLSEECADAAARGTLHRRRLYNAI